MSQHENALVVAEGRAFRMPNFGNRVHYLQDQINSLSKKGNTGLLERIEQTASKLVHKVSD